ncbi:WXG100 family type VII secretion target [Bacillus pacificus]|uniref:WXG100 family type VII secretion target n=1 Tax=Bacillus pacificus TaxID=2026187 RepID=UPI00156B53B4|nr:WXG100 family type VII secretion target [Bacillus pacificus]NRR17597.1 WXG100 family type VII secretion target [Bacillus pacificus]
MVQIKVTPEELERVAKRANDTKHALESIHNNLCNQIDYMCFQWTGASNQNFVQMFNNARPIAFTAINAIVHVEEELKRIAEKFRVADSEDVTSQKTTKSSKAPEKSFLGKVWDGIVDGAGDAVGDTIDGIKALGDWETWKGMGYTVTHLDEALPAMWDALSDSFNKDVINGDAETRARWGSYALTQIGLGLLGDKGVSKAAKLAQGAKFSQGISKAGQLFNKGDNLAFAGGNGGRSVFDSATFKQAEEKLSTYQFSKGDGSSEKIASIEDTQTPPLSNQEVISSLQGTENFKQNGLKHILEGEINRSGNAVGYHSEALENTPGKIIRGTEETVNNQGIYKAKIEVNGTIKTANGGFSTFFPKDWTPQTIVDNVNEAYNNKRHVIGNTYKGVGPDGVEITMYLDSNGKIISAFPKE